MTDPGSLAELMEPEFVLIRGCVLLEAKYEPANFRQWWDKLDGAREAVEAIVNHVHLWDVVGDVEEREVEAMAQRMADRWRTRAAQAYPDRVVTVSVTDDYGPTVTLTTSSGMTSIDAVLDRIRALRPIVERLAAPAEEQIAYLTRLGVADMADELALEFDDLWPAVVAQLSESSALASAGAALDAALSRRHLGWSFADLESAEWQRVRELAASTLAAVDDELPRVG